MVTKDFPIFDCDSHVVEPPEIWDEYVPSAIRSRVKSQFHFHTDTDVLHINGRVVPATREQEGGGGAGSRHRGMAAEIRAPGRVPRAPGAAARHGRARHRSGDALPDVVRPPGP